MSTTAKLAELERFLPPALAGLRPVLGGLAAAAQEGDTAAETMSDAGLYENAEGAWLTLHGSSLGVRRATGESDASLRERLRTFQDLLTRPTLEAAIDAILDAAGYAGTPAVVIEEFQDGEAPDGDGIWEDSMRGGGWCDRDFADCAYAMDGPGTFAVVASWVAPPGVYELHPMFSAVINEVNRLRAAGVRWWLVLE